MSEANDLIKEMAVPKKVELFEDAKAKGRAFLDALYKDIADMYNTGMPDKTLISNVNAIVEPSFGFDSALQISDLVGKSLKHLKGKENVTAMDIRKAVVKQSPKRK